MLLCTSCFFKVKFIIVLKLKLRYLICAIAPYDSFVENLFCVYTIIKSCKFKTFRSLSSPEVPNAFNCKHKKAMVCRQIIFTVSKVVLNQCWGKWNDWLYYNASCKFIKQRTEQHIKLIIFTIVMCSKYHSVL